MAGQHVIDSTQRAVFDRIVILVVLLEKLATLELLEDSIQDFVLLVEDGEDRVAVEIGKQTEILDLSD